jgi:hypothetical protein
MDEFIHATSIREPILPTLQRGGRRRRRRRLRLKEMDDRDKTRWERNHVDRRSMWTVAHRPRLLTNHQTQQENRGYRAYPCCWDVTMGPAIYCTLAKSLGGWKAEGP